MIILLLTILLFAAYGSLLLYFWWGWRSIPVYRGASGETSGRFSIVIAARNEEENIGGLLAALEEQDYPREKFEVLVVNDHSTDKTALVVKEFKGVKLINLEADAINSYKKKAISEGIKAASHEWILTTDADCLPGRDWLRTIASFREESDAMFIAAPVSILCNPSLLQSFQAMDFMMLQVITGAAVHRRKLSMCNGANIAYSRKAFGEVNGFDGIDQIASGDDMLLMHKISEKYPGRIRYLKSADAIMGTAPMRTWKEFFNQRIRWASKARKYQDKRMLPILLLIYLFNLLFPVLLLAGFWNRDLRLLFVGLWIAKTLVEFPLFLSAARFFNKRWAIRPFFFFQPLHIFYTIVSGLLGQKKKYKWKGREVR